METAPVRRRPTRVVTDSEDDQFDGRQRQELTITSKRVSTISEEKQADRKKKHAYSESKHTIPIHTLTKASVLSKEAPPENYSGFIRLGMLVLGASNIRLVIENWMKYGLLIRFPHSYIPYSDYGLFVLAWLSIPISLTIALLVEYSMARLAAQTKDAKPAFLKKLTVLERVVGTTHVAHLLFLLTFPSYIVYTKIYHPLVGSAVLIMCLVTFLKMTSYVLVNRELRQQLINGVDGEIYDKDSAYPMNVHAGNLLYFFFAPTLCYQPSYPRSPRFRKTFLLKRIGELVVCLVMMYVLTEQYAKPTLANSLQALEEKNYVTIVERVLKLSTTAVVIWLLMFYAFFHSFLNALSEILRFGDRTFYLAWWNSSNLATYWRLWNRPVYLFFKRHVYLPSVQQGLPPAVGQFLVFLVSAILHEVLVGIPTHAITGFAFWGMLGQIPLIAITRPLEKWRGKGSALGNTIFWVTFCVVGQPTIALLYYYQWTAAHKTVINP
ncbi:MBOAT, membrane-bound O-acyltransferase family-domain-containing protein [Radiomyces spectabilis]|uniref:MBOAT, membrane-bound O-acyltransferase family-domain-containing protein n=1 Tax=Radiomyces spectabilis TaxID=64574 RepID=UPI00221F766F|nr:MBOAT, membrane-bound O-acyltransferase family-domain-containing protein [Radiomyces spectabilis]KAI8379794.1 MBOAT, membrane-bound O-acyltransferase family-domain-containing protein [Radiomyces spectabilis]